MKNINKIILSTLYYMVSFTNFKNIIANTISVIDKQIRWLIWKFFLSKLYDINSIVGLPIETLNSLQQLAEAINSDANFFDTIMNAINSKSDIIYVNTQLDTILRKVLNYDTIDVSNIEFLTKSNKVDTDLNYDVDVFLYTLQAAIDRRVLMHAVYINYKFKINATAKDILQN